MKQLFHLLAVFIVIFIFFTNCKKEFSCESCLPGNSGIINQQPIADAGADQRIVLPKDSILLDGSASSDVDGKIVSYKWLYVSGPTSFTIANSNLVKTRVYGLVQGLYKFALTVIDNNGLSAKDTIQIFVDNLVPVNHPPHANAGADQTVYLPDNSVIVDGSSSTDPDNNITSYKWTKIAGPTSTYMVNTNAAQTRINDLGPGVYQFELQVTDNGGLTSRDTVSIIVTSKTVSGLEFVFNDLTWQLSDFYSLLLDDVWVGTPARPDLFTNAPGYAFNLYYPADVYLKFDTASNWLLIKSVAEIDATQPLQYVYDIEAPSLYVHVYPLNYQLVGRKASIKVKFL